MMRFGRIGKRKKRILTENFDILQKDYLDVTKM